MDRETLKYYARLELSRRSFWEYCKFTSPDFYKEERIFLRDVADTLQWFVEEAEEQIAYVYTDDWEDDLSDIKPPFGEEKEENE